MSMVLRPNVLSLGNHEAMHGEWRIGQIEKRSSLYGPEDRWILALNGVPGSSPKGIRLAGVEETLDEAQAELKKSWEQWLAWAGLSAVDSDPPSAPGTSALGPPPPENGHHNPQTDY
jgi:hypothetical protein